MSFLSEEFQSSFFAPKTRLMTWVHSSPSAGASRALTPQHPLGLSTRSQRPGQAWLGAACTLGNTSLGPRFSVFTWKAPFKPESDSEDRSPRSWNSISPSIVTGRLKSKANKGWENEFEPGSPHRRGIVTLYSQRITKRNTQSGRQKRSGCQEGMPVRQRDARPCRLGWWRRLRSPATFHSPLPGAEIDDEKSVIFVGVNVMEEVEGRGAVLDIEEPPFFLLCHVKPDLKDGSSLVLLPGEHIKVDTGDPPWPMGGRGLPVAYPHGLVGLEAVHVVGSPQAPGGEELEQVDFHRGFNKHNVVRGQSEAVRKHTGSTSSCWSTWLCGYSTQSRA